MTLTPPPAARKYPEAALEQVRAARERLDAAANSLAYHMALAREEDAPWAAIAQQASLSELTCRRRVNEYRTEKEAAA